ncbi:NBS-LRR type resistance protein [Cucumis melo var. makuwa]|uniref:NBS-LRR type resistance protein n=1 Tax=Cucumis melo var. makuwa TaxID=1194695 RepID=A0A5A7TZQ2_CUCMM|nr:NBS-LRR type resistance protein [Cucumis melo var. makuwa]TYK04507.1 NBS-LRR type resistance protein [Cucumis melo var. makuwa]
MSSLSKEGNRSTMCSCSGKHTFETRLLYHKPQRKHIIKCYNSSPNLSHMVLSHSLGTRYTKLCWVDNQTTQKALVGDLSPRLARRPMRAVPQPRRTPR